MGFIFISCGKNPQLKVGLSDNGPFAVDLSLAPDPPGVFYGVYHELPEIEGKGLTVEAWVKSKSSSLNGSVVAYNDANGIVLFVNNNQPKLAILREPNPPETVGCSQLTDTSTECIVGSNVSLEQEKWTHLAGVLSNADHSGIHDSCGGPEAEIPHLDIYVDGRFQNCATAGSKFPEGPQLEIVTVGQKGGGEGPPIDNGEVTGGDSFDGVVDEVRFWMVARTAEQIQTCMGQELSFSIPGDCYIDPAILKGYWRFNEGEGDHGADFSGGGGSGGFESPPLVPWGGGWVTPGAPITPDPD
jgi:hypothetical protein